MKKEISYCIFGGVIVVAVFLITALCSTGTGRQDMAAAAVASPVSTARATSRSSQAAATRTPAPAASSSAFSQTVKPSQEPPISVMDAPIEEKVTRKGLIYEYTGLYAHLIGCTDVAKKRTNLKIPAKICVQDIYYDVTMIDCEALSKCTKLKQVTIGKYVKQIRNSAFLGDTKLKKVVFKGKKLKNVGDNAFKNTSPQISFYMPATVKSKYTRLLKNGNPAKKAKFK